METFIFTFVIVLTIAQLASGFCLMKYAQTLDEKIKLNAEYIEKLLKLQD